MSETSTPTGTLKRTPLNDIHRQLGARMVEFGGWDMPVQYTSILEEHRAVRDAAGLFDVSHMGEFELRGPDVTPYLSKVLTNDPAALAPGEAQYNIMCYLDGGTVDDLYLYKLDPDHFLIVVNAGNIDVDFAWMMRQIGDYDVTLTNRSDDYGLLALQGPRAFDILRPLTTIDLGTMKHNTIRSGQVAGIEAVVAQTGYTGESGYEIMVGATDTPALWNALLEAGAPLGLKPAGLGARDTLRLEAAYPLYGHELDEDTNPLEAGLGFFVKLDKGEFNGRETLAAAKANGPAKRLIGFEMVGRGIPRSGYEVAKNGETIGVVTSGTQSPTLGRAIGLAYVKPGFTTVGDEVDIIIRGAPVAARIVKRPFYKRAKA